MFATEATEGTERSFSSFLCPLWPLWHNHRDYRRTRVLKDDSMRQYCREGGCQLLFLYIILVVVMMAIMATVFTKGTVYLMGKYGGESINRIHRDTEFIINTRKVPKGWQIPWEKRMSKLETGQSGKASRDRIEKSAHQQSLKRIHKLIRHFERTSMIEDEEARELVLKELKEVHAQWQSSNWEQIKG